MRKVLFFILSVLLLVGCSRPEGVLGIRKMENVLYDMHKTDGIIFAQHMQNNHPEDVNAYYQDVLDKYGITQTQFDSSLVYYTTRGVIFEKMYDRVVKRIQKEMYEAQIRADVERAKTFCHLTYVEQYNRDIEAKWPTLDQDEKYWLDQLEGKIRPKEFQLQVFVRIPMRPNN